MARHGIIEKPQILEIATEFGAAGVSADIVLQRLSKASRSTINRRLAELVLDGSLKKVGAGRGTRYVTMSSLTIDSIKRYLAKDWRQRPPVPFDEALLAPAPMLDSDKASRLTRIQGLAQVTDQKYLSNFLIDISWASSALEGSKYTELDTQALIEYGQRNQDKPIEDAVLVLAHKVAIEYLWEHREITTENICRLQAALTNGHDIPGIEHSDHFLPAAQRGVPREYEDLNLNRSAYIPPMRPGTGYVAKAFSRIVETAVTLPPMQAAFYLMTRIPYLQVFANGNKRTARLAANMPLLSHGLLPISFVDFDKAAYIQGMSAFYELGDIQILESVFVDGYIHSCIRGSAVPAAMRVNGFDSHQVAAQIRAFVNTGVIPKDPRAAGFVIRDASLSNEDSITLGDPGAAHRVRPV